LIDKNFIEGLLTGKPVFQLLEKHRLTGFQWRVLRFARSRKRRVARLQI
jgi:hypothetical protein